MNLNRNEKKLIEKISVYRRTPELFAREVCGFVPDDWQRAVFDDIANFSRVTVRSGQGVGKTSCEAILCLWFLSCFPFSRVVATAPTRQQLSDILWAEVSKWLSASPVLNSFLRWSKTKISVIGHEDRWFAAAKTAARPENMQGFHEKNMLFIVDEASGVSDDVMEAVLGTLSGKNNKLLMCGNPTKTSGIFFDSHNKDCAMYRRHRVSARDSVRTNKESIQALEKKYGRGSNFIRVRVDGEFPRQEDDVIIPLELITRSVMTPFNEPAIPDIIHIGCDVARFGSDRTVIGYKVNEKAEIWRKINGQDTMKTADDIVACADMLTRRYPGYKDNIYIKIDDGGVGGGVVDRLRQLKNSYPERFDRLCIVPVKFGMRIKHPYYHDTTTYMMNVVKNLLSGRDEKGGGKPIELILPDDPDLTAQLSGRKYVITDASKQKAESKDDIKKRGGHSPDEADCILLCCLPVKKKKERGIMNTE